MKTPQRRRRATAFVPRIVLSATFVGVIPACVSCNGGGAGVADVGFHGVADSGFRVADTGFRPDAPGVASDAFVRPDASVADTGFSVADVGFRPDASDGAADTRDTGAFTVAMVGFDGGDADANGNG